MVSTKDSHGVITSVNEADLKYIPRNSFPSVQGQSAFLFNIEPERNFLKLEFSRLSPLKLFQAPVTL